MTVGSESGSDSAAAAAAAAERQHALVVGPKALELAGICVGYHERARREFARGSRRMKHKSLAAHAAADVIVLEVLDLPALDNRNRHLDNAANPMDHLYPRLTHQLRVWTLNEVGRVSASVVEVPGCSSDHSVEEQKEGRASHAVMMALSAIRAHRAYDVAVAMKALWSGFGFDSGAIVK